jgi:2-polyprenyl-3-methyl-5-hydroxy-6-metoxy-1,4-benzoquinol methylase
MARDSGMSPAKPSLQKPSEHRIEYLSQSAKVSMADRWFEIASIDHFWVRRRFEVLQRLAGGWIASARELAEIGCGHGLLQRQVEDAYGRSVTGFDLNEFALKQNISRRSKVCCYDIYQQDAMYRERFDVIFLFDVLEHIADEDRFLKTLLYHLAPGGTVVVNVPAGHWAFSNYDCAAGHVRRYSLETLKNPTCRNNLEVREWSYWGLPMVPMLVLRKLSLRGKSDQREIITAGFDSRTPAINKILGEVSRWEPIPQHLLGTSLMVVFQAADGSQLSAR